MIKSVSHEGANGADLKRTRRRKAARVSPDVDRLPPHSPEAERGVLGCILLSPNDCLPTVIETFKQRSDCFFDLRHQTIFDALQSMHRARVQVDVITLQQHLKDESLLEDAGGIQYLAALPNEVPSAANLSYYLDIVQEKYLLRKIIHTCTEVVSRVYDFAGDVDLLVDETRRDLERVFCVREKSGRFYSVDDLDAFNPNTDANNRIGNRWLCRGGKLIIPSASGAGKSSLVMQMLVLFALGLPFCGIQPHGPQPNGALSALMVGDENDIGDLSEMFQGTRDFLESAESNHFFVREEAFDLLRKNLKFWHCPALAGDKFLASIEAELRRNPRDICCIDPLVSFAGVDLTKQDQSAKFLREGLTRIAEETGVIWFVVHHTPKPQVNPGKRQFAKKTSEYQYAGAGSFDLPGWARAVMTLDEATDGVFRLVLAKRGRRAGATHPDGSPTTMLWMRHASKGIHWEQCAPPEETEDRSKQSGGRPSKVEELIGIGLGGVIDTITLPKPKSEIARLFVNFAANRDLDTSYRTALRAVEILVGNKALKKVNDEYQRPA